MARKRKSSDRRTNSRPTEPTTTGRSTVSVARAHKALRTTLPDVIYRPRAERPKPQTVQADQSPPATKRRQQTVEQTKKSQKTPTKGLDLTPAPTCKKRPTKTSGNGTSRAFAPWCK